MHKQTVTLSLDKELYKKYREYCDEYGLLVSRQIEIFMDHQMKNPTELKGFKFDVITHKNKIKKFINKRPLK